MLLVLMAGGITDDDSRYSRLMIPVFKMDREAPALESVAPPAIVYRVLWRLSVGRVKGRKGVGEIGRG